MSRNVEVHRFQKHDYQDVFAVHSDSLHSRDKRVGRSDRSNGMERTG
jgi:hypothetical protein